MTKPELTYLKWDSIFFERKVYKCDLDNSDTFIDSIKEVNADLIYLFSKKELDMPLTENFILADKKVIFSKRLDPVLSGFTNENIISANEVTRQLLDLAIISGHYSRFKVDRKLNSKFPELYRLWLEKSITRELASDVLVYKSANDEIGFVTVKKKGSSASIGLIAVNESYHGKNIGSSLIKAVENWCSCNSIDTIEVVTQSDNIQACNFYRKNGFEITQTDYIYHYHKH